jgi:hypothetical protein
MLNGLMMNDVKKVEDAILRILNEDKNSYTFDPLNWRLIINLDLKADDVIAKISDISNLTAGQVLDVLGYWEQQNVIGNFVYVSNQTIYPFRVDKLAVVWR